MEGIAAPYRRSPSAVLQAWALAQDLAAVVTSANSEEHIKENLEVGSLGLSEATRAQISAVPERVDFHEHRSWEDPWLDD
jgi:diketogulonate reductase-like aldo/keto reductase